MLTRIALLSAPALALALPVVAQGSITSPAGYLNTDGTSNHDYILFDAYMCRWQQIDHTHKGTARPNMNSISFRRDAGVASDVTWTARNLTNVRIIMAHVDPIAFNPDSSNLNGTYKDMPVTTVTIPNLALPDWTTATGASPEPFSVSIPFTTGWNYNGTDDFVWEVVYDTNDNGNNYGNDFVSNTGSSSGYNSTTGSLLPGSVGCIPSTDTSDFDISGTFYNYGTKFRLRFSATDCTANETAYLFLGFSDPNITLGGMCGPIRTDGLLLAGQPLGVASATGSVSSVYYDNIPYVMPAEGVDFYGQLMALDLGSASPIQVVVSDGKKWTMPVAPTPPNCTRLYNYFSTSTSTTMSTSGPWYGGIVAKFDHM